MNWLRQHRNILFVFLVLLTCYSYFLPRWANWSQNSRLDLVLAIVDEGTLSIDNYYQNTGDYFCFNRETREGGCENGGPHFSDKAPGTAFLAVPVYAAARPILRSAPVQALLDRLACGHAFGETLSDDGTGLTTEKVYAAIVLYLVTVVVVSIPSAVLGTLIYSFLGIFTQRSDWRIGVALLYGLATNAFPYSGAFYGHQIVAFLLFGAFYLAFAIGQGRTSVRWTILVGLMLAYAVITEYPTALIAGAVFGYTLLVLPDRRWVMGFVLSGLPPAFLLMAHDWAILETVLPLGYRYSELYKDNVHAQGFLSLVGPNREAMWGITFGSYRGLFFVAPILLLAIPGFVTWWRQRRYRLEWGVCLWAVVSFFLFNGSSVMWHGAFSIGPRYLVPMVPFLATSMGAFVIAWGTRWWAKLLAAVLGAWSFAVIWIETLGGQRFPDWTPNPLFDYSLPKFMAGDIARNLGMGMGLSGHWSLVPLLVAVAGLGTVYLYVNRRLGRG
jgi:hypothetical protein